MITVGVRELKQHASELIRTVRTQGSEVQVTYRGSVVALIIPVTRPVYEEDTQKWVELDSLAAQIGKKWPSGISAINAIQESRR